MKHKFMKDIKELFIFLLLSVSTILLYNNYSYLWIDTSIERTQSFYIFEFPIALLIALLFYFSKIQNKIVQFVLPLIPIMTLLISFDIFYSFLSRSPRYSDFMNFSNIYDFYPILFFAVLLLIIFIIALKFILLKCAYKTHSPLSFTFSLSSRLAVVFLLVVLLQTPFFQKFQSSIFKYIVWSDQRTLQQNGRVSSFIFFTNLEKQNYHKILCGNCQSISISQTLYPNNIKNKRNIYIVVLESFFDPNLFHNITYQPNPLAKELEPYLQNRHFSKIISPVYGGYTAQAEFEILTGVKAFGKVNTIDFNTLCGGEVQGFVTQLKKRDYHTVATVAAQPFYFNSRTAYKSLGFEHVDYLQENENFVKDENDEHIFDGDILEHNIKMVKKHLETSSKPLFNYVIGMYGHLPYNRNLQKRPDVIKLTNFKDSTMHRIANQFYYRSKALGEYLKQLRELDPNGIIFVTGDHLPPILTQEIRYKYDKYINSALMLDGSKHVMIDNKRYYEIPWKIWDILSQQENPRDINKTIINDLYFKALKESM